jgi:hypothetical protein
MEIRFFQPKSEFSFCVKIAQKWAFSEPNWLPNGKNIGQVHVVYHIHLNGGKVQAKWPIGNEYREKLMIVPTGH